MHQVETDPVKPSEIAWCDYVVGNRADRGHNAHLMKQLLPNPVHYHLMTMRGEEPALWVLFDLLV